MLAAYGGNARKLFNVAGADYRELGLKERLAAMTEEAQLALLGGNGNLVKRPFLLGPAAALVGFDEAAWAQALLSPASALPKSR
jgi:arsenate reductase